MASTKKKMKPVTTQRANSTPTKQVAILEADEESTDLLPQGLIRSEVNFLSYPFFALSRTDAQKRMKAEYSATITRGNETLDVYWKVSANPEYGYPGPFDRKVHKAIEHIISNLEKPIKNPIPLGSFYSIAQLLNLKKSGRFYSNIKAAIRRIVTTSVESRRTLYDKGKKRWLETTFHIYDRVVFIGEELDNGEVADTNYLYLDSLYLDNINNRYVKPLDYTYYRSLKDGIASRLYELLGVKFYGMGHNPYIRYRYSTLCQLLPMTRYQYISKAKEKFNTAHQELSRTGFLSNAEWQEIPGARHDWYLHYYPGPRAREEIKQFNKQAALPPPDDLELGQMPPAPRTPQQADEDNDDVANALQNFGISKKQALRLAEKYPEEKVLEKLDMVQWLVEKKSPLVSKNPQGFLIKAIEDDYPAPTQYKGKRAKASQPLESEEQEARLLAQEEYRRGKEKTRQRLLEKHPPQPIEGTDHTTHSAWGKVLATLQEQVSPANFNSWLKDTALLQVTDTAARIAAPSTYAMLWLERRLYREISNAMKGILGKELDLEFVVANPE